MERFKEWTSRRTWKERKKAARERETAAMVPGIQHPELIFYGRHSGIVGLCEDELYQTVSDSEFLSCGYDKVNCIVFFLTNVIEICSLFVLNTSSREK